MLRWSSCSAEALMVPCVALAYLLEEDDGGVVVVKLDVAARLETLWSDVNWRLPNCGR